MIKCHLDFKFRDISKANFHVIRNIISETGALQTLCHFIAIENVIFTHFFMG